MKLAVFQSTNGQQGVEGRFKKLSLAVKQTDCDLMICPELFVSGYNAKTLFNEVAMHHSEIFLHHASLLAKDTKTALVIGYPEHLDGKLYNSAAFIDNMGQLLANHRKLVIPPGFEKDCFTSGSEMTLFDYMGIKCAMLICYDAEFPETVRKAAYMGAELVIVPTALNVNWPVVADKVMPTRAFENGVWLAYANHAGAEGDLKYYGHSCIVTPTGADAARAGDTEQVIVADIDAGAVAAAQKRLPYLRDVVPLRNIL